MRSRKPPRPTSGSDAPAAERIGYLVHDLGDAAVARRIRMFRSAGLAVTLAGFARSAPPAMVEGIAADCLGRTYDGRLINRLIAVAKALPGAAAAVRGTEVLVARNLEMLILAVAAKRGRRIVYECLDIHRTLTGGGRAARLVQRLERGLLRHVDAILTSSPRFVTEHFAAVGFPAERTFVFENKVLAIGDLRPLPPAPRVPGAPWKIGWFGMLRCRRSLALLAGIAAESQGRITVVIAGRPSPAEFPDFAAEVDAATGVRFVGAYRPDELAALYGAVDFAWAIDFFEEGENSTWLLPNRLYEASAYGVVPIALARVETGAWLLRHQAGLIVDDAAPGVAARLAALTDRDYRALRDAVLAIADADLVADAAECAALGRAVTGRRDG